VRLTVPLTTSSKTSCVRQWPWGEGRWGQWVDRQVFAGLAESLASLCRQLGVNSMGMKTRKTADCGVILSGPS